MNNLKIIDKWLKIQKKKQKISVKEKKISDLESWSYNSQKIHHNTYEFLVSIRTLPRQLMVRNALDTFAAGPTSLAFMIYLPQLRKISSTTLSSLSSASQSSARSIPYFVRSSHNLTDTRWIGTSCCICAKKAALMILQCVMASLSGLPTAAITLGSV